MKSVCTPAREGRGARNTAVFGIGRGRGAALPPRSAPVDVITTDYFLEQRTFPPKTDARMRGANGLMRRLPIRTDSEGPKAAEIALHARSDVFSPSGRPLLERVFLFTVVRRNRAAKYGREIWRGRRTCSRATMRSHPSPHPLHGRADADCPA